MNYHNACTYAYIHKYVITYQFLPLFGVFFSPFSPSMAAVTMRFAQDEIDAIGGKRFSQGTSADREIQRTLKLGLDGSRVLGRGGIGGEFLRFP